MWNGLRPREGSQAVPLTVGKKPRWQECTRQLPRRHDTELVFCSAVQSTPASDSLALLMHPPPNLSALRLMPVLTRLDIVSRVEALPALTVRHRAQRQSMPALLGSQTTLRLGHGDARRASVLIFGVTSAVALDLIRCAVGLALAVGPANLALWASGHALPVALNVPVDALALAAGALPGRMEFVL